jgi:hypothetical protein
MNYLISRRLVSGTTMSQKEINEMGCFNCIAYAQDYQKCENCETYSKMKKQQENDRHTEELIRLEEQNEDEFDMMIHLLRTR